MSPYPRTFLLFDPCPPPYFYPPSLLLYTVALSNFATVTVLFLFRVFPPRRVSSCLPLFFDLPSCFFLCFFSPFFFFFLQYPTLFQFFLPGTCEFLPFYKLFISFPVDPPSVLSSGYPRSTKYVSPLSFTHPSAARSF